MWWETLSLVEQISFSVALAATGIIVIFLVLMLLGIEGTDFDGVDTGSGLDFINDEPLTGISGLRLLNLRSVIVFLAIGGWLNLIFFSLVGPIGSLILSILGGLLAAYLQALAFRASMKLESSGNLDYHHALHKEATVYLRIPKKHQGKGKVTLVIQERYAEIDAVTDEDEDIMPKTLVEIVSLEDQVTVKVKRK